MFSNTSVLIFLRQRFLGFRKVHSRAGQTDTPLPAGPGGASALFCQRIVVQCGESCTRSNFAIVSGYIFGNVSSLHRQESVGEKRQRTARPFAKGKFSFFLKDNIFLNDNILGHT